MICYSRGGIGNTKKDRAMIFAERCHFSCDLTECFLGNVQGRYKSVWFSNKAEYFEHIFIALYKVSREHNDFYIIISELLLRIGNK